MVPIEPLISLGTVQIAIPAWQLAFFIVAFGMLMLFHQTKGCLLITYAFALYWGYLHSGEHFLKISGTDPYMGTLYIVAGLVVAALGLMAVFYEE